ncbi:MAG: hypothetical protein DMG75_14975, partial [Acidobacteria bacterium]
CNQQDTENNWQGAFGSKTHENDQKAAMIAPAANGSAPVQVTIQWLMATVRRQPLARKLPLW